MTLAAPNLDDRSFQQLVDEAKLRLAGRCPEWTDHNVSDPGVMLIELVAGMVDQLIFRLNQVPDRLYVKFLELIGLQPEPSQPARVDVTFWLGAPQPRPIRIEPGTQVATRRAASAPALVFSLTEPCEIPPCSLAEVTVQHTGGAPQDLTGAAIAGDAFACFADPPSAGDAFELGLTANVEGSAVRLEIECDPAYGQGVDPDRPPLVWEARIGDDWRPCEWTDRTGGLNRTGDAIVHVPRDPDPDEHAAPTRLRCRVIAAADRPGYERSPRLGAITAATIGATREVVHGELRENEPLGRSDGRPGQRFRLASAPAIAPEDGLVVESRAGGEVQEWTVVGHFAASGPEDRHVTFDSETGEIAFGPGLHRPDSERLRHYGAVPPAGAELVVRSYVAGGGEGGNVGVGAIAVLKTTVPFVARVENRAAARGGRRAETLEELKLRGPLELRSLERAVTAEDYERFARAAAGGVARVRCRPAADQDLAQVALVPRYTDTPAEPAPLERLRPSDAALQAVRHELDRRRVIGARFTVGPARYRGVRVDALVQVLPGWDPDETEDRGTARLHAFFHPLTGGPDRTGWPFGRDVHSGMAYVVLQETPGIELVRELRLYEVDLESGRRSEAIQRLELEPDTVVVSRGHTVAALRDEEDR